MTRLVFVAGLVALVTWCGVGEARAGFFGSRKRDAALDEKSRPPEDDSYDREDGPARARDGYTVREVTSRRRSDEAAPRREPEPRREEPGPRARKRYDEQAQEDSLQSESRRHGKEMQELERRLEEAEQSDNSRKIKAVNWMITRENAKHEKETERLARQAGPTRARRFDRREAAVSREPRDDPAAYGSRERERGRRDEGAGPDERGPGPEPRRTSRFSRERRGEEEVSNPIRERDRREHGLDRERERDDKFSRGYDRDDLDDDRSARPQRSSSARRAKSSSNAARVAAADGPIRR